MAVAAALGGLLVGGTAVGQVSGPDAGPAASGLQEIVVTGSRIRRIETETPSPVQVVTTEDIKESGFTSVSQVLQNLTANGQGTLSNAFPGAFAGSATGVSLRGLNTSATLVLIDGHRMAPFPLSDDGQRSFVDISSIPFDAVDRVEVLKDGASAVYGSDAMAGVVNIILKKSYTGTNVTAEGGTTTEGGGATGHASVMHGMGDLDSDGYNAYVNLEYRHQNEILQSQRRGEGLWSSMDQTSIGGDNLTPGIVGGPGGGTPPAYGTVYLTPLTGAYSAANSYFYPTPIKAFGAYNGACTYAIQQTGGCAFINPQAQIQPTTDNVNFLASLKKKFGEDWVLDVKASLFESRGQQYTPSSTSNGLNVFPSSASPQVAVSAGVTPYIAATPTITAITVPASYPGNPFGAPAKVRGVILDAPVRHTDYNSKSYRFAADLTGKLLGWDVDTSIGYTRVDTKQWDYSLFNRVALNAALNRPTNPFLITGGNTQADLSAIFPVGTATDTSQLEFAEINFSRSVFDLPGGALGVAAGAQVIDRQLDAPAPAQVAQGLVYGGNNAFVVGSQIDDAVYGEFAAPILKVLELDGHVRYDHFSNSQGAATPSLGFKFKPVDAFALRGTWGRGFRAPNPAENGNGGQAYSAGTTFDPILCPGGDATAAGAVLQYCNFNPPYENSSNPKLKPEESHSETVGIIVEPIRTWTTTLDFFRTRISNQIVAGTANIDTAVRSAPVSDFCSNGAGGTVSCIQSVGAILYIPVAYVNANSTQVTGLELTTRYNISLGDWGNITTEFDWSRITSYLYTVAGVTYQLAGTHGPAVIGGNTGNPKDRMQGSVSFNRGPLTVRTTLNWISSFSLTDPSGSNAGTPVLDCATAVQTGGYYAAFFSSGQPTDSKYCRVQSFLDTDLYASYAIGDHLTLHGSVTNLFNEQPPLDLNTYGGGNLPYNPSMHQAGAVGRFINVGAAYKF